MSYSMLKHSSEQKGSGRFDEQPDASDVPKVPNIMVIDKLSLTRAYLARSLAKHFNEKVQVRTVAKVSDAHSLIDDDTRLIILYAHHQVEKKVQSLLDVLGSRPDSRVLVITDRNAGELEDFHRKILSSVVCGVLFSEGTDFLLMKSSVAFAFNGGTLVPKEFFTAAQSDSRKGGMRPKSDRALTSRQMDVFNRLSQGKANKIIAFELGMSESTVKVHVRNIFATIGATNRTQAVFLMQNMNDPEFVGGTPIETWGGHTSTDKMMLESRA